MIGESLVEYRMGLGCKMHTSCVVFSVFVFRVQQVSVARKHAPSAARSWGRLGNLQSDSMRGTISYTCGPLASLLPPNEVVNVCMYNTYLLDV